MSKRLMSIPIAIAVVRRAGEVLIGQRGPGSTLAGLWEFPGGKVLPGESPAEAAARECREETGLAIQIGRLLAETDYDYPHGCLRLHFFEATAQDPQQSPAAPYRWIPLADLRQYEFPPANASVLAMLTT
jgi:mutator protein MutT